MVVGRAEALDLAGASGPDLDGAAITLRSHSSLGVPGFSGFTGGLGGPLPKLTRAGVERIDVAGVVQGAFGTPRGIAVEVAALDGPLTGHLRDLGTSAYFEVVVETQLLLRPWGSGDAAMDADDIDREVENLPLPEWEPTPSGGDSWSAPLCTAHGQWRTGRISGSLSEVGDVEEFPEHQEGAFGWFAYAPLSGAVFPEGGPGPERLDHTPGSEARDEAERDVQRLVVPLHDDAGRRVKVWDCGEMRPREGALELVAIPGGVAFLVTGERSGRLVLVDRELDEVVTICVDVDIHTALRERVPRPPEADSYESQMLDRYRLTEQTDVEAVRSELVGEWPHTQLVWTFRRSCRAGLMMRRSHDLYDELGRPCADDLEYIDVHLDEDIATGHLPPASAAVNGILDV